MNTREITALEAFNGEMGNSVEIGRALIAACEHDLARTLSTGERRDLLMDNTPWDSDLIRLVVAAIA